jgi:hypothetical protein
MIHDTLSRNNSLVRNFSTSNHGLDKHLYAIVPRAVQEADWELLKWCWEHNSRHSIWQTLRESAQSYGQSAATQIARICQVQKSDDQPPLESSTVERSQGSQNDARSQAQGSYKINPVGAAAVGWAKPLAIVVHRDDDEEERRRALCDMQRSTSFKAPI